MIGSPNKAELDYLIECFRDCNCDECINLLSAISSNAELSQLTLRRLQEYTDDYYATYFGDV